MTDVVHQSELPTPESIQRQNAIVGGGGLPVEGLHKVRVGRDVHWISTCGLISDSVPSASTTQRKGDIVGFGKNAVRLSHLLDNNNDHQSNEKLWEGLLIELDQKSIYRRAKAARGCGKKMPRLCADVNNMNITKKL